MEKQQILLALAFASLSLPSAALAGNPFVSPEYSPIRPQQNAVLLAAMDLRSKFVPDGFAKSQMPSSRLDTDAVPSSPPASIKKSTPSSPPSQDDAAILSIAHSGSPSVTKGSFAADALPASAKTLKYYVRDPHILALMKHTAEKYNLPPELLLAISIRESGVNPGALNTWGEDYVYKTPDEAIANLLRRGVTWDRSFDCGVMQINSQHAKYFGFNILNMFDPQQNIDFAGRLLRELIDAHGYTWRAIGRYHTPIEGDRAINYATSVLNKAKELQQYNIFAGLQ